jgi:hypothetical protein
VLALRRGEARALRALLNDADEDLAEVAKILDEM